MHAEGATELAEPADAWQSLERLARRLLDEGHPEAWSAFFGALYPLALPELKRIWRRLHPASTPADTDDVAGDLLLRAEEKLRRDDYRALRSASALSDGASRASLRTYLQTVLGRLAIDYQRTHPQYRRPSRALAAKESPERSTSAAGRWVVHEEHTASLFGLRPALTRQQDCTRMLRSLDELTAAVRQRHAAAIEGVSGRRLGAASRSCCLELALELGLGDVAVVRHVLERGHLYRRAVELVLADQTQHEIADAIGLSRREVEKVLEHAMGILRARFAELG